jgi:hypothetical protein
LTFVPEESQAGGSTADLALAFGEELAPNPEAGNRLELRNISLSLSLWYPSQFSVLTNLSVRSSLRAATGGEKAKEGRRGGIGKVQGKGHERKNTTFSASM